VSAAPYRVLVADDFKSVLITSYGGDGAGAYAVTWFVPKQGHIARFVADSEQLTLQLPKEPSPRIVVAGTR
jgi:hypothetical protein